MKAVVLRKIGAVELEDCVPPRIQDPGDVIVRVTTAGICGSDLHIIHGRDPGIRMGTIMGHEFTGVIEETGDRVSGLKSGDRVVAPFTVNCGTCYYCRRDMPGRCVHSLGFGFIDESGAGLHGAQTEYVRVPLASSTLMRLPDGLRDEDALFLGDILSTAYSCAENANIQEGDVVTVIGCGPVGLLAVQSAMLFKPSAVFAVDTVEYRLEKARELGAIPALPDKERLQERIAEFTDGRGADAVLEAVGTSAALDLALGLIRPGAIVSIAGYHTESSYALPIQFAYTRNLTLRIGRCHAGHYMRKLLPLVLERRVNPAGIITHVLPLNDALRGYDIFTRKLDSAIKVLLKP